MLSLAKLASDLAARPSAYIFVVVAVFLVLSYPTMYLLPSTGPDYHSGAQFVKSADIQEQTQPPDFVIQRVWVGSNGTNIINRVFLTKAINIQRTLLDELDNEQAEVSSALSLWNDNPQSLITDSNLHRTIQKVPEDTLSGVVKTDGLILSAKALWMVFKLPNDQVAIELNSAIANLSEPAEVQVLATTMDGPGSANYALKYSYYRSLVRLLLDGVPWISTFYHLAAFHHLEAVRSRATLFVAFVIELVFTVCAAYSSVVLVFKSAELTELPILPVLATTVFIVGENTFRLITAVADTSAESNAVERLHAGMQKSSAVSVSIVATAEALLAVLWVVAADGCPRQFVLLTALALGFHLLLHFTLFSAMLLIEIRRAELEDLLKHRKVVKPVKTSRFSLPLLDSPVQTGLVVCLLLLTSLYCVSGVPDSYIDPLTLCGLGFAESKRGFTFKLARWAGRNLYNDNESSGQIIFKVLSPVAVNLGQQVSYDEVPFVSTTIYSFDSSDVIEFVSFITFVLSGVCLTLKVTVDSDAEHLGKLKKAGSNAHPDTPNVVQSSPAVESFKCKDLEKGHFLDIVKIATSSCPFIVSVGIDQKVLVWSPLQDPVPQPTQLPVSGRLLPITGVVMSASGSLIAIFSKCGVIRCWSRLSMSWVWTVNVDELKHESPLVSFFRQNKPRGMRHRRPRKPEFNTRTQEDRGRAYHGRVSSSSSSLTGVQLMRSVSMDSTFNKSTNIKQLRSNTSQKEFVIVLPSGRLLTVDCTNGTIEKNLISSDIVAACKLLSPRVNDRIVAVAKNGDLVVTTAVGAKWITRRVPIKQSYTGVEVPSVDACNITEATIVPVPFVSMVVRTYESRAQLIDVNSGILFREWGIGQFKPGSFKVFHPEPSHCRFCGCASISSFSVAYTELETDILIMHTFSIDNRAKNRICMRVERDPRETRCLGFASASEHQHWLYNVEGWCATDLNVITGIRRKNGPVAEDADEQVSRYHRYTEGLRNRHDHQSYATEPADGWEGFMMGADGNIDFYAVPDETDIGLLIKKLGPVQRFGHKSLVAAFGNIMKVLYLGNDSLIEESDASDDLYKGTDAGSNSLNFINRRRKMTLKKYRLTHSTDFNDSLPSSAVTSDAE